jgi:hypothetical protein
MPQDPHEQEESLIVTAKLIILDMVTEGQIRQRIAACAGNENIIERTKDGHIGEMELEIDGCPIIATIVVEGEWDDWYLESVRYA